MEFCTRPDSINGVRLLPEYDMTLDICISHIHIKNTMRFVEQCHKVNFVLDCVTKHWRNFYQDAVSKYLPNCFMTMQNIFKGYRILKVRRH